MRHAWLAASLSLASATLFAPASDALYSRFTAITGWELRGYSFDPEIDTKDVSQWNLPFVVVAPLGRSLSVDLTTRYAVGQIEMYSGRSATLASFTDTQVRVLYTLRRDRLVPPPPFPLPTPTPPLS